MLKVIHVCGCEVFADEYDLRTVMEDDFCQDFYVNIQDGQKVWTKSDCHEIVTLEMKPITDIYKPIEYLSKTPTDTCNLIPLSTNTFEETVKRPRGRPKKLVAETEITVTPKKTVVKKNVGDGEVKVNIVVKKVVTKVSSTAVQVQDTSGILHILPLKKVAKKSNI